MSTSIILIALLSVAPSLINAQSYYNDSFSGSSYGVRIGIGISVALGVAGIVLLSGYFLRRKRARAFKDIYPVQPTNMEAGMYNGQPIPMNAPAYNNYTPDSSGAPQPYYAPPPGGDSYPPPAGPPPTQYAPPDMPPAAATSSTYYAPPEGPPPTASPAYNPTDVK